MPGGDTCSARGRVKGIEWEQTTMEKFGELIRDERHFLKMNQNELGKKIGVTGAYITQIEKGQKIPSLPLIVGLAKALRIDEKHLLKVALKEKVPEVAAQFFEEKAQALSRKGTTRRTEAPDEHEPRVQGAEQVVLQELARFIPQRRPLLARPQGEGSGVAIVICWCKNLSGNPQ